MRRGRAFRRGGTAVGLVALAVLLCLPAQAEDEAPARAKALLTAHKKLERRLSKIVPMLVRTTGRSILAVLDARAQVEAAQTDPAGGLLDGLLLRSLLREGVPVLRAEAKGPAAVAYRGGKLPRKPLLPKNDVTRLRETTGAAFLLETRWKQTGAVVEARLRLRETEKRRTVGKWDLGSFDTSKVALADVLAIRPLPAANVEILLFSVSMFGTQVARGECWDLPALPLQARGFEVKDYDFGTRVLFAEALPGDVLTIDTRGHHHVMVLSKKGPTLGESHIYHQNWNKRRVVMDMVFPKKMEEGLLIWRPGVR